VIKSTTKGAMFDEVGYWIGLVLRKVGGIP